MKRIRFLVLAAFLCVVSLFATAPQAEAATFRNASVVGCSYFDYGSWTYVDRQLWSGDSCQVTDLLEVAACYTRANQYEKMLVTGRAFDTDQDGAVLGNSLKPAILKFRGKKTQRCAHLFFQNFWALPADQVGGDDVWNQSWAIIDLELTSVALNSWDANTEVCQMPDDGVISLLRLCSDGTPACPTCSTPCGSQTTPN
ncbi:MAG: hypothetical protein WC817_00330 [Patescibacteria group bacterium]|jgi:hypothetical protein